MSAQRRSNEASELEEEAAAEEELLKLEEEVEGIAQRILDYRTTLPDKLSSTLASLLASQRPVLTVHLADEVPESEAQAPLRPDSAGTSGQENMALVVSEEPEEAEKVQLFKQKISSNASKLPAVLKRMKESIARIEKLDSTNGIIPPAFKRKRP